MREGRGDQRSHPDQTSAEARKSSRFTVLYLLGCLCGMRPYLTTLCWSSSGP